MNTLIIKLTDSTEIKTTAINFINCGEETFLNCFPLNTNEPIRLPISAIEVIQPFIINEIINNLNTVRLEAIPNYGEVLLISSFNECLKQGIITEDDGNAYWAIKHKRSYFDAFNIPKPEWATHVVYFGK